MNKEKNRELTTEQLEKRAKITKEISNFSFFMGTLGGCITLAILILVISDMLGITTFWGVLIPYIVLELFFGGICSILDVASERYENDIIKQMAGKGSIKDKVILRDEKYINNILDNCATDSLINIIKNTSEDSVELSREQKRKIANSIIDSIEIEKAEDETVNVIVKVGSFEYGDTNVSDKKLREVFDLK